MTRKLIGFAFLLFTIQLHAQNVGIGTAIPAQKLHVAGNVQFDNALMPGGLAGVPGDVLTSQGPGVAPVWQSVTLGQQFTTVYTNAGLNLAYDPLGAYTVVPGLTQVVTVPAVGTYDVFIYSDGSAQFQNVANVNRGAQLEISIWIDGAAARYMTTMVDNTSNFVSGIRSWATSYSPVLAPGPHTIEIRARHRSSGESNFTVGAPNVVGNYLISSLTVGLIKR